MWTSYEAICELGGPSGSSDEADDPNTFFGVDAPVLSPRNTKTIVEERLHRTIALKPGKQSNLDSNVEETSPSHEQESFALNRFGTPSTPYTSFDKMTIGVNNVYTNSQICTSAKGRALDIHNHLNRPATGSTIAPRSKATANANLPQTNLFNVTPAVAQQSFRSPILETPDVPAKTPGSKVAPSSAIGYAEQVLTQARRVAQGLFYEPSPEAIDPRMRSSPNRLTANRSKIIIDSRFNDMSAIADATAIGRLSFSTNLPTTPNVAPSPFNAGVSSVKGDKRALSPVNMESRKKPGQEKIHDENETERPINEYYELDNEVERSCVRKVLQLLSSFGAAYKYLSQVRWLCI